MILRDSVFTWHGVSSDLDGCRGALKIEVFFILSCVASKPVCGPNLYKLRSSVLTSSLKLSVLCERLRIRIVISGLLIVNHGFRFR